jgi:hypothetical protein
MGSLIPSENWDWRRDWPKAVIGVVVTILFWATAAAIVLVG